MRDSMWDDTAVRVSLPPAARTTAATVNGTAVDTRGNNNFFQQAMVVAVAGTVTDGTHTVKVQDSDDGTTGWADVPASAVQGSLTQLASNTVQRLAIDQITRRYLRCVVTTGGTPTTGGVVGAVIVLRGDSGARAVS